MEGGNIRSGSSLRPLNLISFCKLQKLSKMEGGNRRLGGSEGYEILNLIFFPKPVGFHAREPASDQNSGRKMVEMLWFGPGLQVGQADQVNRAVGQPYMYGITL